ncbi:hypothetical protein Pcaca05_23610 [Pectobacterium carotovorum subsp. carotovorum]|nr:hypothetical protein Pcaca05_23610 [Pectobacterium carotovorum subsp. carotovorum]
MWAYNQPGPVTQYIEANAPSGPITECVNFIKRTAYLRKTDV